jgi:hypothetical protein
MQNLTHPKKSFLRVLALSTALATTMALPAAAQSLPAPYVSRALDAVLIPVDDNVRAIFGLTPDDSGVMVLATAPGGIGEAAGLLPGDVVATAYGRQIADPIDLDAIVYYWLNQGNTDFGFDVWSGGVSQFYTTTITIESYTEIIDVTTVSTWSSYSSESFSFEEYSLEYSEEISESYESAESMIEETISSDDFTAEQEAGGAEDEAIDDSADEAGGDDTDGDEGGDDTGGDEGGDDTGGDEGGEDVAE